MKTKPVLTPEDAAAIQAACKAEAERNGWAVSVAVVDDGGHVLSVVRLDGAGYATPEVALRKARTAAMTRRPTAAAEEATLSRLTLLAFGDRLPLQGGLPILVGGECAGAVGVSGVASADDEKIAQAGIAALGLPD